MTTLALGFIDSWITIAAAIGVVLCVAHVVKRGVDAFLDWRLPVESHAEEAGS